MSYHLKLKYLCRRNHNHTSQSGQDLCRPHACSGPPGADIHRKQRGLLRGAMGPDHAASSSVHRRIQSHFQDSTGSWCRKQFGQILRSEFSVSQNSYLEHPFFASQLKKCFFLSRYYGVVSLIPIFQYSNVYSGTPQLRKLAKDIKLQKECTEYVSKSARHPPNFRDIFLFYASMARGTTVKDLCIRLNPHAKRINERKLVQFGVLRGFIQRIYKVLTFCLFFYLVNFISERYSTERQ